MSEPDPRADAPLPRMSWSRERGFYHDPLGPWVQWRHVERALAELRRQAGDYTGQDQTPGFRRGLRHAADQLSGE